MAARLNRKATQVPLSSNGTLRLGVVADTHSNPHPNALSHVRSLHPSAILHGGDIGDLDVLERLREVAPVLAVRGNIDTRAVDLPDVLTIDVMDDQRVAVRILLVHIAVNGPRIRADVARMARSEGASLVVCGHSHVPFIGQDRGLTLFNPGSIGPRRFTLPIVFGAIDVGPKGIQLNHFDAETGLPWSPPSARG